MTLSTIFFSKKKNAVLIKSIYVYHDMYIQNVESEYANCLFVKCIAYVCETFETPPENKKLLSVACRMKYTFV